MNNEIKEILAYFEQYVKITDMHDSEPMLNWKDLKIVLDYITNLQQENERLKQPKIFVDTQDMEERYGEELYKDYLEKQVNDYKSRIEKAVEYGNSCISKDLDLETLDEPYKTTFKTAYEIHNNYLDILNGRSDE